MTSTELDITIDARSAVPLYEQICQQIRQKIESKQLAPGMALPTNHELCARLRINYKTAQQAMATLAQEGYVTRQARRGTVVKGIPRRVVGIYAHFDLLREDGKHEYYRLITGHLIRLLESHGRIHRLYLGSATPQAPNAASEDLLRHLTGGTLCGVLLVNAPPQLEKLIQQSRSLRVPVIALSAGCAAAEYSAQSDLVGMVRVVAAHLHAQGCRRVGVIFNRDSAAFRQAGMGPDQIAQILQENNLSSQASWIVGRPETEQGGYDAAASLHLKELDGLIVEDDVMALGVDRRLSELGIDVPGDLMVATYWNHGSRLRLTLPFERFELDVAEQAHVGLQLMQDAIHGRRIAQPHVKILPTLSGARIPGKIVSEDLSRPKISSDR